MTNLIHIAWLYLNLTNTVIQIEPGLTNNTYLVNFAGTNIVANTNELLFTGYVGEVVKLIWEPVYDYDVVLQSSEELIFWYDTKVIFKYGAHDWYVYPTDCRRYYRLRFSH